MIRHRAGERGSASVEFLSLGVLLLVPLIYLVITVAKVEAATFAAEGAARHAARLAVATTSDADRARAVNGVVAQAMADFDLDPNAAAVRVQCEPADCRGAGAHVEVTVTARVALPLVPDWLVTNQVGGVQVAASATYSVSRFASEGQR
ncbi:MAG TPA: TadE family protein [Candidatus Lumbricidophila sp.]|nr:TadE family protein [Candidatus Lumbricidophila sp.]